VIFMRGLDSGFIPFFRNWPALVPRGAGGRGRVAGVPVRVVL